MAFLTPVLPFQMARQTNQIPTFGSQIIATAPSGDDFRVFHSPVITAVSSAIGHGWQIMAI
ncbi:hypothetical protein QA601_16940 [Chitinispirillales bacterium ANBcel5]|uniref:hypothetical protein n=1 Tax=Cellulosispirillum alkaliphilum TaxID=3039283 RepID=UPI002A56B097|nr:hypothetical protein [Chitinispirillales bacterium ANBcel5]